MYIPNHFRLDESKIADFITNHPFATLISQDVDGLLINYAPLIYDPEQHCLIGHLSNNNQHLQCMKNTAEITIIFHGAEGYISPNWYSDKTQVPTWNFTNVEVKGRASLIQSSEEKLQILETLSAFHEQRINSDWKITKMPEAKLAAMLTAITGFRIQIDHWKGKEKLSQNKSLVERSRLIEGLQELKDGKSELLAQSMIEMN